MQIMQESMLPPSIEQLTTFMAVARQASFAGAADVIGKDASVLTRRVHALEQHLGVKLFERTTRRLALTEAGQRYLERVSRALEELTSAQQEANTLVSVPRGWLRLSLPRTFAHRCISPWLPEFMAAHPEIQVDARHTDQYVDLVAEHFDVAIRLGETLSDSGLVARPVAEYGKYLYASPDYLQRKGMPTHPAMLDAFDGLIYTGAAQPAEWLLSEAGQQVLVQPIVRLASDDVVTLLRAACCGLGVIASADWAVQDELANGELVKILPTWSVGPRRSVYVVTPSRTLLPAKTRVFIDWASQRLAQQLETANGMS
ncbi:DNA-binding transcriptional LysR family regulator [Chitinivorax tropicus]|uniref:DNA-binding transcriptional LysR family regulator n=1 Tax=Chitinivorax tropicus TaxID=714531 RepID=A0A840MSC6_9PROT|nr:LysR family transcriptional regulator [Chitinivorax tropicus]MBB5020057.1 DNA-binding transcriptional LysR family regulator [Chitinivorax tropicus]